MLSPHTSHACNPSRTFGHMLQILKIACKICLNYQVSSWGSRMAIVETSWKLDLSKDQWYRFYLFWTRPNVPCLLVRASNASTSIVGLVFIAALSIQLVKGPKYKVEAILDSKITYNKLHYIVSCFKLHGTLIQIMLHIEPPSLNPLEMQIHVRLIQLQNPDHGQVKWRVEH